MANLAALRSAIRESRAILTASRAVRRSTAAGLSAEDLARAARSSWAFFASAAALSRSAKLVFLDLFISTKGPFSRRLADPVKWDSALTAHARRSARNPRRCRD